STKLRSRQAQNAGPPGNETGEAGAVTATTAGTPAPLPKASITADEPMKTGKRATRLLPKSNVAIALVPVCRGTVVEPFGGTNSDVCPNGLEIVTLTNEGDGFTTRQPNTAIGNACRN